MTQRNNLATQPIHPASLGKRMLQGAGIALILIIIFLVGAGEPNPDWAKKKSCRLPLLPLPVEIIADATFRFSLYISNVFVESIEKKYRNEMLCCIPINPINPINPGSDYTSLCYGLVLFWD